MSIVKSLSVGNGDMYYIKHDTDSFSIIDCCINEDSKEWIVPELISESKDKNVIRFISTHPDDDHIRGLKYLHEHLTLRNFYCVKNDTWKDDWTEDFEQYCDLRDSNKAFYIYKGCNRRWINHSDNVRKHSGLHILWPITNDNCHVGALSAAAGGDKVNNISPIIKYRFGDNLSLLWMGDLETEFMESIVDKVEIGPVEVLFAPHHGRDSGKVPTAWLKKMKPKIIVIGEAPSHHLNYYPEYNSITQNSADDITFDCDNLGIHVYVSNPTYSVDFLEDLESEYLYSHKIKLGTYIGSLVT